MRFTNIPFPNDGLRVTGASYWSNFQDGSGRSYICDDRDSYVSYQFRYFGKLASWRSYFRGETTGLVRGDKHFYPRDQGVIFGSDRVEVTYIIHPGTAPQRLGGSSLDPQSIVVIDNPKIIGYARLYLKLYNDDSEISYRAIEAMPILSGC
ncbi:MAG: hypothetical protein R2880_05770 [Deinococcales bacterium]